MAELKPAHEKALMLAALCGFKIALGPAFLRASRRSPSTQKWATAALGEMALDKLGVFPARYRPMLLIPHTVAGAWTAHESLKEDGEVDPVTLPILRIALRKLAFLPDYLLGLGEDYVALQLGSRATGITLDQVKEIAQESMAGVGGQVRPALQKVGIPA